MTFRYSYPFTKEVVMFFRYPYSIGSQTHPSSHKPKRKNVNPSPIIERFILVMQEHSFSELETTKALKQLIKEKGGN